MNDKDKFIVTNKDGNKETFFTIATYSENNKNYIVYTDGKLNKDKKLNVYYALYEDINNKMQLIEITDPKDKIIAIDMVKAVVEDLKD